MANLVHDHFGTLTTLVQCYFGTLNHEKYHCIDLLSLTVQ